MMMMMIERDDDGRERDDDGRERDDDDDREG